MTEDRRLADITTIKISAVKKGEPGYIEIKGPIIFLAAFILILCSPIYTVFMLSRAYNISLQDGQYNRMCGPVRHIEAYIYQHYDHGLILADEGTDEFEPGAAGIDNKHMIYQGSDFPSSYWAQALVHPEQFAEWVVIDPYNTRNIVAHHINVRNPVFNKNFELVAMQSDGSMLFHKRGLPPLPNRAPMPRYAYPHYPCQ